MKQLQRRWPIARMSMPPPYASAAITKPVVTPEEAASEIIALRGAARFCSARNASGLDIQDVALARKILTVPINPEFRITQSGAGGYPVCL